MLEPVLPLEGKWTVRDIDADFELGVLIHTNALERVGSHDDAHKDRTIGVYRWKPSVKRMLTNYVEGMNSMPCNRFHRAHIIHHPSGEGYTCKYCDDDPQFDRETVRELL